MKQLFVFVYIVYILHLSFADYPKRDVIELFTPNATKYNFFKIHHNFFTFKVKASNDAVVGLFAESALTNPWYEIVIGGWDNSKSAIRKNEKEVTEALTPNIIKKDEYTELWVRFYHRKLAVGLSTQFDPFLVLTEDMELPNITYIGFYTGSGATGDWIINLPRYDFQEAIGVIDKRETCASD